MGFPSLKEDIDNRIDAALEEYGLRPPEDILQLVKQVLADQIREIIFAAQSDSRKWKAERDTLLNVNAQLEKKLEQLEPERVASEVSTRDKKICHLEKENRGIRAETAELRKQLDETRRKLLHANVGARIAANIKERNTELEQELNDLRKIAMRSLVDKK